MKLPALILTLILTQLAATSTSIADESQHNDEAGSHFDKILASRPTARTPSYTLNYSLSAETDFDDVDGNFSYSQLTLQGGLYKPIKLHQNHTIIINSAFTRTNLQTDTFLSDLDLYELSLNFRWIYSKPGSRWAWVSSLSPSITSDLGEVSSESFALDGIAGFNYQKSASFSWLGGFVFFLNDFEKRIFPGIGFRWRPDVATELEYTGIRLRGSWQPSDDWIWRFDARPAGGTWHINENNQDLNIDVDSYQVGIGVEHRLTKKLWLGLTGGITLGNELEIETSSGRRLFREDAETGWFGQLGLRLTVW